MGKVVVVKKGKVVCEISKSKKKNEGKRR